MTTSAEPLLNLRGPKVALGPLRRDALPHLTRWFNDFEVTRTLAFGMKPVTAEAEEAWYASRSLPSATDRSFLIFQRSDLHLVGICGLHRIDPLNGLAELGILIGEKHLWGKGYATEACKLLLEYGFTALGLHSVMLRAFGNNSGGLKAYERAGFKEFGRWRGAVRVGKERVDMIHMDCLASEFEGTALRSNPALE